MFPLSFVNYQIAILKEEFDKAEGVSFIILIGFLLYLDILANS